MSEQDKLKRKNEDSQEHHCATSQIGGKGTIRRRRLRKAHLTKQQNNKFFNENLKNNFLNKYKIYDEGHLDSVTLIKSNGNLKTIKSSKNAIKFHANSEKNLFHFSFSEKTDLINESSKYSNIDKSETNVEQLYTNFRNNLINHHQIYCLLGKCLQKKFKYKI
jgi:hypothetical protein